LAAAALLLGTACGGGEDTGVAGSTTTAPAATTSAQATNTTTSAQASLVEGRWSTTLGEPTHDTVTLLIQATSYQINRGSDVATGDVQISGDVIQFTDGTACPGTGLYQWTIDGEALRFSLVQRDPCPGRVEVLAGVTYQRTA
jgi:hypothetical protein